MFFSIILAAFILASGNSIYVPVISIDEATDGTQALSFQV